MTDSTKKTLNNAVRAYLDYIDDRDTAAHACSLYLQTFRHLVTFLKYDIGLDTNISDISLDDISPEMIETFLTTSDDKISLPTFWRWAYAHGWSSENITFKFPHFDHETTASANAVDLHLAASVQSLAADVGRLTVENVRIQDRLAEDPDAIMTDEEVEAQLDQYEQQFGMSSEEFLRRVRAGTAPDEAGIIDWKLLLKYR